MSKSNKTNRDQQNKKNYGDRQENTSKMIPGTDEYQEHWESLGQQRMFEKKESAD